MFGRLPLGPWDRPPFPLICISPEIFANACQMILMYINNLRHNQNHWSPARTESHPTQVQKVVIWLSDVIRRFFGFFLGWFTLSKATPSLRSVVEIDLL